MNYINVSRFVRRRSLPVEAAIPGNSVSGKISHSPSGDSERIIGVIQSRDDRIAQ